MTKTTWTVGELARLTGVSVRTLHHYHEIDLLCPSGRSEAGYRLYDGGNVARLQQIVSLRSIGLSLDEVRASLDQSPLSAAQILDAHMARLEEQIAALERLHARLAAARTELDTRRGVSVEELARIIEEITMTDKYFNADQMTYLDERKQILGEERIREVEAEWPRLMDEVRAAIERGESPESPLARSLAQRWNALVEEFTGGDTSIRNSLDSMYRNETTVAGIDVKAMQPLYEFIAKATAAARE